jgi:hypothetical protein
MLDLFYVFIFVMGAAWGIAMIATLPGPCRFQARPSRKDQTMSRFEPAA